MPKGLGFYQPEETMIPTKEQLKRFSQMLAQRHGQGQSAEATTKEITNDFIKGRS